MSDQPARYGSAAEDCGDRARIHGVRKGALIGGGFMAVTYGLAYLIQIADQKFDRS